MVIRIIVEGGVYPNQANNTHSATDLTLDGSEVLREELKKFFTAVLGIADISIIVSIIQVTKMRQRCLSQNQKRITSIQI